jgi:hypothetical protein
LLLSRSTGICSYGGGGGASRTGRTTASVRTFQRDSNDIQQAASGKLPEVFEQDVREMTSLYAGAQLPSAMNAVFCGPSQSMSPPSTFELFTPDAAKGVVLDLELDWVYVRGREKLYCRIVDVPNATDALVTSHSQHAWAFVVTNGLKAQKLEIMKHCHATFSVRRIKQASDYNLSELHPCSDRFVTLRARLDSFH